MEKEGSLIFCLFRKIVIAASLVGPVSSLTMGSCPDLQYPVCVFFCEASFKCNQKSTNYLCNRRTSIAPVGISCHGGHHCCSQYLQLGQSAYPYPHLSTTPSGTMKASQKKGLLVSTWRLSVFCAQCWMLLNRRLHLSFYNLTLSL